MSKCCGKNNASDNEILSCTTPPNGYSNETRCTDTSKIALSIILIGSALCLASLPALQRCSVPSKGLRLFYVVTGSSVASLGACALITQVFCTAIPQKQAASAPSAFPSFIPPEPIPEKVIQEPCDETARGEGYHDGHQRQNQHLLGRICGYNTMKACYASAIDPRDQSEKIFSLSELPLPPCPPENAEKLFWKSYYQGYVEGHLVALQDYLNAAFAEGILSNQELSYIVGELSSGQICLLRQQVGTLQTELNFSRFSSPLWREDPLLLTFSWKIHIDTSSWRSPYEDHSDMILG